MSLGISLQVPKPYFSDGAQLRMIKSKLIRVTLDLQNSIYPQS